MDGAGSQILSIGDQAAHFLARDHRDIPNAPLVVAAAWRGPEVMAAGDLFEAVPPKVIEAFEQAMRASLEVGSNLDSLTRADIPLPAIAETVMSWRRTLLCGRGFLVLRGFPVHRWDLATQKLFMRLIGLQFGRLGLQNPQGDVIGEVRDTGAARRDPFARLYATSGEFCFHCDAADLVALLCVRPAMSGGESRIASSVSVFNEILRQRPDLAPRLFEPLLYDLRNEQQPGHAPYAEYAPCAYAGGVLKTFYISDYFRTVERHGVRIPPRDRALLDLYDAVATSAEIGLSFFLQPGDLQILNNHTMLHARTAFVDSPGAERLLLRALISIDPGDAVRWSAGPNPVAAA